MDNINLKLELHKAIDNIQDNKILAAAYTLLTSSKPVPEALSNDQIESMLEESELAITKGKVIDHKDLKEEISSWRNR